MILGDQTQPVLIIMLLMNKLYKIRVIFPNLRARHRKGETADKEGDRGPGPQAWAAMSACQGDVTTGMSGVAGALGLWEDGAGTGDA